MTIHYPFPVIRHIDDVLSAVEGRPEFIVVKKDYGLTIINYAYQDHDTFPPVVDKKTAILRECRGIVFDTVSGRILNRRYHKFFNLGEKSDSVVDVGREHCVLDKLDGSMISPCYIDGGIRWISKMGLTDVSMQAETYVADNETYVANNKTYISNKLNYIDLARVCLARGKTTIFEWLSRQQRIVLDYGKEDQLVLLAIRDNTTGNYYTRGDVERLGHDWGIPVVQATSPSITNIDQFLSDLRQKENTEGVVIAFADGHMVKVKTDWYVQLHRAKDKISRERHLIALIIEDKLDDLLPVLPLDDRERVEQFASWVHQDIKTFGSAVYNVMDMVRKEGWDRKSIDLRSDGLYHPPIRSACFTLFDASIEDIRALAVDWGKTFVLRNLGNTALEKARQVLLTARWDGKVVEE